MNRMSYVLVTPAHNEEATIGLTIESVAAQRRLPDQWVIVSDGSTDGTDRIIQDAVERHPFIAFFRRERGPSRSFGAKVSAILEGIQRLNTSKFDFIGFMDADITVEEGFFEAVLVRMSENPRQGLGGGAVYEKHGIHWRIEPSNYSMCVAGAVQVFRKACYEEIGGLRLLPYGGVDMVAETMARMHGWTVMSFLDLAVYHHHRQGRTHGTPLRALFRRGKMEYVNGYHPLFQLGRFFSRLRLRPLIVGSVVRSMGYLWAMTRGEPLAVPADMVEYLRREQLARLRKLFHVDVK